MTLQSNQHEGTAPMAKQIKIIITDDISGEHNANTYHVGIDDEVYEINLSSSNFDNTLGAIKKHGMLISKQYSPQQVRVWAKSQGVKVSNRGRLSDALIKKYIEAGSPIDETVENSEIKTFNMKD